MRREKLIRNYREMKTNRGKSQIDKMCAIYNISKAELIDSDMMEIKKIISGVYEKDIKKY